MKIPLIPFLRLTAAVALTLGVHAAAVAAPVCVDPGGTGGIGGTGAPRREGGIGGTGAPARSGIGGTGAPAQSGVGGTGTPAIHGPAASSPALAGSGIGGTGAPASEGGTGGTGIVGTITGFASICVNGVEVHYEDAVPVSENGRPGTISRLAVGQVVAVEAGLSGRGLEAREIAILHAYEGPLTALPSRSSLMRVMGQAVSLAPRAEVDAGLRVGEFVRVSGFRNARGEVVATRVERAPALREASAIGTMEGSGSLHGLALSGANTAPGETLVRGRWTGRALEVADARADPATPFAGRVRTAIVEGLVLDHVDNRLEISGFHVDVDADTGFADGAATKLARDRRIRVHGVFTGARQINASRIEFVHEGIDAPGGGARKSGQKSGDGEDESRGRSGKLRVEMEDGRVRIEKETESGRERIERELSPAGEVERERVERQMESPTGELLLRERTETRISDDRIETRERLETFDRSGRRERLERIDRVERPERLERQEKLERPERIERPEHD